MTKTRKNNIFKTISLAAILSGSALFVSGCDDEASSAIIQGPNNPVVAIKYEVWAADQSNSVAGAAGRGIDGSFMWIWEGTDVAANAATAQPLGCGADANVVGAGPCDIHDVFPGTLVDGNGQALSASGRFGRLHGMLSDPQSKYMNFNSFVTGGPGDGGFVGIVDGRTKEAIALWQVAKTSAGGGGGRSVHMSFWSDDGNNIFIANLHGKIVERIDITRDTAGNITKAVLNRDATIGTGGGLLPILETSQAYTGPNAVGNNLISEVSGKADYTDANLGELTPSGVCRQNGCATGPDGANGGRPAAGHVIVCPIVSDTGMLYITFGSGGLIIADTTKTPMTIVAEYGNNTINGAGCGGVHVGDKVWLDAGASAGPGGAVQSVFSVYTIDDSVIAAAAAAGTPLAANTPAPTVIFKDANNTATGGNNDPTAVARGAADGSGQLPGTSTRRDAHGMTVTVDDKYIHVNDRVGNKVEVFSTATESHIGGYDLTSADGQGNGVGACAAASVTDDAGLPTNDPAPDLMEPTPDGKFIAVALRGPTPVSVTHSAQGSCPGVGMIELLNGGASGKLVSVVRSTNTIDNAPQSAPNGFAYSGTEHSDPHGASVRAKAQ